MKRIALTFLLLIAGWFAFAEFVNVAICDGSYDLVVDISPELTHDAQAVAFLGANNSNTTDAITNAVDEMLPHFEQSDSIETLTLNIRFSFRASGVLARTWGHVQEYSHVVVVISRSDGTRDVYTVPVPHRDDSTHIVVTAACAAYSVVR